VELRGCYSVCRLSPPPIKQQKQKEKRERGEVEKRIRGEEENVDHHPLRLH
jgi:hypothetical protein